MSGAAPDVEEDARAIAWHSLGHVIGDDHTETVEINAAHLLRTVPVDVFDGSAIYDMGVMLRLWIVDTLTRSGELKVILHSD